jgi:hypothetical protein
LAVRLKHSSSADFVHSRDSPRNLDAARHFRLNGIFLPFLPLFPLKVCRFAPIKGLYAAITCRFLAKPASHGRIFWDSVCRFINKKGG